MQVGQLLLEIHVSLLLALDVILPVHQLHIAGLNALPQRPRPLYSSLDLDICFFLLHLLLQPG